MRRPLNFLSKCNNRGHNSCIIMGRKHFAYFWKDVSTMWCHPQLIEICAQQEKVYQPDQRYTWICKIQIAWCWERRKGQCILSPQQDTAKTPVLEDMFNCMSCFGIHAIYTCVSPSSNSIYNVIWYIITNINYISCNQQRNWNINQHNSTHKLKQKYRSCLSGKGCGPLKRDLCNVKWSHILVTLYTQWGLVCLTII